MLLAVVADYPAVALPYNNLGYVYYLQGDYGAAAATLRKALALEGGNDRARNNLRLAENAMALPPAVLPCPSPHVCSARAADTCGRDRADADGAGAERDGADRTGPERLRAQAQGAPLAAIAPLLAPAPANTPAPLARVEIANGNGVTGMAKRMKQALGRQGIAVSRLTNARPYRQLETTIEYRAGHAQSAEQLRDALRGQPALVAAQIDAPSPMCGWCWARTRSSISVLDSHRTGAPTLVALAAVCPAT